MGTAGANGSDCTFTADDQDMEGTVIWDSISDLDFYMTNGSTLTGYFVDDETYAGNAETDIAAFTSAMILPGRLPVTVRSQIFTTRVPL